MSELKIAAHPSVITTLGLGSCVGITLYDPCKKIVGLAHVMLPSISHARNKTNIAKFADTAILKMLEEMLEKGAKRSEVVSKLAGGAQMFAFGVRNEMLSIGERNVASAKKVLKDLSIPIISEDTGGNYGRTIEVSSEDGSLMIKTIGHGISTI